MTFPKIYQRSVNDVSMMIDVSIATVYLGGVLTIFCPFCVFFQFLPLRLYEEDNPSLLFLVLIKYVS